MSIITCDDCKESVKIENSYKKKLGAEHLFRCERCHELFVRKSCNSEFLKRKPGIKRFIW